jgi:hypothetical protein
MSCTVSPTTVPASFAESAAAMTYLVRGVDLGRERRREHRRVDTEERREACGVELVHPPLGQAELGLVAEVGDRLLVRAPVRADAVPVQDRRRLDLGGREVLLAPFEHRGVAGDACAGQRVGDLDVQQVGTLGDQLGAGDDRGRNPPGR